MSNNPKSSFVIGALLVFFLFASMVNGQTVQDFDAAVSQLSVNSPSGGPKNNPNALVLVFFRVSKILAWKEDGKLVTLPITPTAEPDDTKQGGPTPVGEYLVGNQFTHPDHKIDWYKLYPRIENNSGYYGYTAKTKTGRFAMGLHPGSVSLGCVTVTSKTTPYHDSAEWQLLRKKLDGSKLTYKNDSFNSLLYVINK